MPLFNVKLPVVALVGAGSPEEAIIAFRQKLEAAGFGVYDGEPADAFESEYQGEQDLATGEYEGGEDAEEHA